jgi:hypothetical protein
MTAPLDEKGLEAARASFVMENSLKRAITAYLAASPSPSEMEVVAWQVPAMSATYGQTGWKFISRQQNPDGYEPGEYEALQESLATAIPLVTLSQAQSALSAMAAERDDARDEHSFTLRLLNDRIKDLEEAIGSLSATDAELVRIHNSCTGVDGDVSISSRMLLTLIDAAILARTTLQKEQADG